MEVTALCFSLLMLEFILLNSFTQKSDAAFLHITPNRLQHFKLDSLSFHCVGSDASTKLRVHKKTECEPECDKTYTGSSSTIKRLYHTDSGEYWCETGGERSNRVNITVADGSVVLESPVLPVMEGESVTLSCRSKTTSTNLQADFYKDNHIIMESSSAEMIINVSKSDEGLYKCSISGVGESPESWLAVREPRSGAPDSPKVLFLLWIAVTVLMLALVLLLVGLLHIRNRRASSKTSAAHSVCVEEAADDPDGVTYAVVVTKPRKDKDAADSAENKSPESNQSTKPQSEGDDDESSCQPVYSALTIKSGPSRPTVTLDPTAAKDSSSAEQEVLYAPVQKAKKGKDL